MADLSYLQTLFPQSAPASPLYDLSATGPYGDPGQFTDYEGLPLTNVAGLQQYQVAGTGVPSWYGNPDVEDPDVDYGFDGSGGTSTPGIVPQSAALAGAGAGAGAGVPSSGAPDYAPPSVQSIDSSALGTAFFPAPTASDSGGQQETIGLTSNVVRDVGGWIKDAVAPVEGAVKTVLGSVADWFVRGALFLLAIVIASIALWKILDLPSPKLAAEAA